jgi:hypothetical protein
MRLIGRFVRKYSVVFRGNNLLINLGMDIPLCSIATSKQRKLTNHNQSYCIMFIAKLLVHACYMFRLV